jgi:prepilin-type N-terminal cleavage/methylation domain-containing protein
MRIMSKNKQSGFTLVELSIVIVIIGLIVAAVTAGQSLVKQAQLRAIISEQEGIKVAVNSFKIQYGALPGDLANASSYWPTTCSAAGAGAFVQAECDGDGNKQILLTNSNASESYMAWLHLSLARLFSGNFVPTIALLGTINSNIPASKFSGAGITLIYDDGTSDATAGDGLAAGGRDSTKNVILFGGAVAANKANGTIFSAPQVYGLDLKVDDGNPVKGTVLGAGVSAAVATGGCIYWGAGGVAETGGDDVYNVGTTETSPCAVAFTL